MGLIMGVETTEMVSRAKARNSTTDSGVAGRSMMANAQSNMTVTKKERKAMVAGVFETRQGERMRPIKAESSTPKIGLSLSWSAGERVAGEPSERGRWYEAAKT